MSNPANGRSEIGRAQGFSFGPRASRDEPHGSQTRTFTMQHAEGTARSYPGPTSGPQGMRPSAVSHSPYRTQQVPKPAQDNSDFFEPFKVERRDGMIIVHDM